MKLRGLIIAIVVLAGLTGALYWSNHHKPAETSESSASTSPKVLSLKQEDISGIDLKKKGGEELVLSRDATGKWQIIAPKPLPVEQATVSPMLSTLSSLNSDRLVEEKAGNLGPYGLADPVLEAGITEKNNLTHKLLLGDDTPTGNAVYAKLEGDPRVFTIPSYSKTSLDKGVNDLRDKRLLTVDSEKISKVEVVTKKQTIEFGRNKDSWQIVKPRPARADGLQVDDLVRTLTDARMDLSASDDAKKIASAFASGAPVATAKVTDTSGTQELQVRKNKDDYYAKSSAVEGVFKVPSSLGKGLDKGLEDFRNKKLFDFGFSDPNKLEMHDGAKSYFLTRNGADWWNESGKKMDVSSVSSLLDKLRDLSADKFPDTGFTTPQITLSATSNDGKRVEKVMISKSGENYVAKRENEPSLYQLDAKAVGELVKSAEEMKPAAAAPSK
ncbi:MAG: DUF4340 domain-containing protein [Acidobacteriia bacterium]|nr:DUF4340 domain-containing protein [Terriglobia bacterium]